MSGCQPRLRKSHKHSSVAITSHFGQRRRKTRVCNCWNISGVATVHILEEADEWESNWRCLQDSIGVYNRSTKRSSSSSLTTSSTTLQNTWNTEMIQLLAEKAVATHSMWTKTILHPCVVRATEFCEWIWMGRYGQSVGDAAGGAQLVEYINVS